MFALTFYLLSLLYLTLSISEDAFIIVSTTEKPSEQHTPQSRPNAVYKNDEEIKELKSRLEFLESKNKQSTTDEIQYRLELLELKNKQITVNENVNSLVKKIEVLLESRNEESKAIYEKIDKIHHKLDVFESKNEQNATDEKMSKILDKFETLDSKIKEIALKSNEQCATEEKLNEIHHKLDVFKYKNEQSANEEKINSILDKFDTLDSKIKEIAQKLGTMVQPLPQPTNYIESVLPKNSTEVQQRGNKVSKIYKIQSKIAQMLGIVNQTLPQSTNYIESVLPKNCREVQQRGHKVSKIYKIQPDSSTESFEVLCDMERRGGGWTYFLNRFDGSQEFNLEWNDYKTGFGTPSGEFWLGLKNIHYLTGFKSNELLVELMDWDNKIVYAYYDAFSVGNESEGYSLKILGRYEGTAGNSFETNAKMKFSTKDRDQDVWSSNCAHVHGGGWWHSSCGYSQLTGIYYNENLLEVWATGIYWESFHGFGYSLKQAKMMIRSKTD